MSDCDVAIIGAGAAGLFAAARIGQAGRSVLLIEHAARLAEKIRISGGGRCNFTNLHSAPENFHGLNPDFCRSALAGYTPHDFLELLERYRIGWHEKHKGQLFCDESAEPLIAMLRSECELGGVQLWQPCSVTRVTRGGGPGTHFLVETSRDTVRAERLVVATGGLSIPKIGASDFGMRLARQFGHRVVEPRPALVGLTFDTGSWQPWAELAGVALEVDVSTVPPGTPSGRRAQPVRFTEDLLFTHRGLSGPAMLQASSYWRHGEALAIDLAPHTDLATLLIGAKAGARGQLGNELARHLPQRLARTWLAQSGLEAARSLSDYRDADLKALADGLKHWIVHPSGSEGWRKAEVTAGGVDTRTLSSRTMESELAPGLYFIGEVVDVTGWLGGYNFQWAWASAAACARALAAPV